MIKLTENSEKNSPQEYDKIFKLRQQKGVDEFDLRRWKTLMKKFSSGTVVDLGCLDSGIPDLVTDDDWYIGIDLAEEAIIEMRKKYSDKVFLVADIYKTPINNADADYVVLGEVLEHLEDPERAVHEAMRILKPDGYLALSVPLNEAIEPGAVDGERHLWSYTEKDIVDLLSPYGRGETEILRSIKEPTYKYCFPQLVAWCKKE